MLWRGMVREPVVIQQPPSLGQITTRGRADRSTIKSHRLELWADPKINCKDRYRNSLEDNFDTQRKVVL